MTDLEEREGGEQHRLPCGVARLVVADRHGKGDRADQESDPGGVKAESTGPQAAAGNVWGASHDVGFGRFLAHGESQQAVRHQVQPQQLQG